jgi:hypothetical protein
VRANNETGVPTYADGGTEWSFTTVGACVPSIPNGNFESGATSWTQGSTGGWPIIINSGFPGGITPHGGSWAAWLGGADDDISYIQQNVTVCASAPYVQYYKRMESAETSCTWDYAGVLVNGSVIYVTGLCGSDGSWKRQSVNLSSYIGQTVTLQFRVETDSSVNSNWFLDDISFSASAAPILEDIVRFFIDPFASLPRQ